MDKNYTLRAKSFYKFLLKNRLFDMYLTELRKQHQSKLEDYDEDGDILKLLEKTMDIDLSFVWKKTSQGFYFWSKLNGIEKREYKAHVEIMNIMRGYKESVNYL